MKGQGTVIIMFSVIILNLMAGLMGLNAASRLPDQVKNNIQDLQTVSNAEVRTDLFVNDYMPMAAAYSVDQASYRLERTDFTKREAGKTKEIIRDLVESAATVYIDNYLGERDIQGCSIKTAPVSVSIEGSPGITNAEVSSTVPLVTTTCEQQGVKVNYRSEKSSTGGRVHGNRIMTMAEINQKVFINMKEKAESFENPGDVTDETECSPTYEDSDEAEADAIESAKEDAKKRLDDIEDGTLNAGKETEMKIGETSIEGMAKSVSLDEGRSERGISRDYSDGYVCECDELDTCYQGVATYNYFYDKLFIDTSYRDNKNEIPVEPVEADDSEWINLRLESTYFHNFEGSLE